MIHIGNFTFIQLLIFIWLIIINVITFTLYAIDGKRPQVRIKDWLLLLLPLIGGSIGACLGNHCFNTCYRHLYYKHKVLIHFLPGIAFIIQFLLTLFWGYKSGLFIIPRSVITGTKGILLTYFIIVGAIAFLIQLIYSSQYYWLPNNKERVSLRNAVLLIIAGGAPLALVEKLLFNFKYHDPTNPNSGPENFIYGNGIWLFTAFWGLVIAYLIFNVNVIGAIIGFISLFQRLLTRMK